MPTPALAELLGTTPLAWGPRAGVANVDLANARQLRGAVRRLRRHLNDDVAAVLVRGSVAVKAPATASVLYFVRKGALNVPAHAPYDPATALLQTAAEGRGKSNFQRQLVTTFAPTAMARGMESLVVAHGLGVLHLPNDDPGDPDAAPADAVAAWYAANVAAGTVVPVAGDAVTTRDLTRFAVAAVPPPTAVHLLADAAPLDLTQESGGGYDKVHRVYMLAAYALLKMHAGPGPADGKFVAALMAASDGRILAWGINTNRANMTHHAEVNMVQSYFARQRALGGYEGLPPNTRVYTTLQCCRMCAGMLHHSAGAPNTLRVYYGVPDPGQNDGTSALQGDAPLERRLITGGGGPAGVEFVWSERAHRADGLGRDYSQRLERRMAAVPGDAASKGALIADNLEHLSAHEELARKYHKYYRGAGGARPAPHFARHEGPATNPHVRNAVRYAVAFLAGLGLD